MNFYGSLAPPTKSTPKLTLQDDVTEIFQQQMNSKDVQLGIKRKRSEAPSFKKSFIVQIPGKIFLSRNSISDDLSIKTETVPELNTWDASRWDALCREKCHHITAQCGKKGRKMSQKK